MKCTIGVLGLLLVSCTQQLDGSLVLAGHDAGGSVGSNAVEERVAALVTGLTIFQSVNFRDSLFAIPGKSDGSIVLGSDYHLYMHSNSAGGAKPWSFQAIDSNAADYGGSCTAASNPTWYGIANFNVNTDVYYCGQGITGAIATINTNECVQTIGQTVYQRWGGEYTVSGNGDGTGQRAGIMAFSSAHQVWEVLVRKISDVHPSGNYLEACPGRPQGPGNVGDNLWLAI